MNYIDKEVLTKRLYKLCEQLKETNVKDSYLAGRRQDQLGSLQQGTDMFVEPAAKYLPVAPPKRMRVRQ